MWIDRLLGWLVFNFRDCFSPELLLRGEFGSVSQPEASAKHERRY
jgi:hypothetical protein